MNTQRTDDRSVTEGLPAHYELLVIKTIGPFNSHEDAVAHAKRFYPGLEQDPDHIGDGWDVQIAGLK